MPNSEVLFRNRRYDEAIVEATTEIARDRGHEFGSAWNYGRSLLLLGRYQEAQQHFEEMTAKRLCGSLIGGNFTCAGLAFWFDGHSERAIKFWESGLKAGYQAQFGIEIPWVLLYASARRPDCFSRDRALQLVKLKSKRLSEESGFVHVNEFVLKNKHREQVLEELAVVYSKSRFAAQFLMEEGSLLDFWAGVHALYDNDEERFYEQMLACASITRHENVASQLVIAECELQQGPTKWQRKFASWLQANVLSKPVPDEESELEK